MVKFKGNSDKGKKILGLALSEMNLRKLKEGMPILVDDSTFFDGQILIMYGRTEAEIIEELRNVTINDNLIIREDKDKQ